MSGTTLKQLDIDQVQTGMFLCDVFDKNGLLLLSANTSVDTQEQINILKKRGVTTVFIDPKRGKDISEPQPTAVSVTAAEQKSPPEQSAPSPVEPRENAYYVELERARETHQEAFFTAREVLTSIREGKSFSSDAVRSSSEHIVESILRNPDALVSLSQIKGYDEYTYTHSLNVGILVTSLANEMGYTGEQLVDIGMGGLLHDIGKMQVPERIINKPGKLSAAEFSTMKRHPEYGLALLRNKRNVSDIAKTIVHQHHERYNGSGYPQGIQKSQIQEVGLIAAVADVYDALTSDRVYKSAWTPQKALAMIFTGCDQQYSRTIVERFTKNLGIYPIGSFVRLNTNEMGVVIRIDKGNLLSPVVLILFNKNGKRLKRPYEHDLGEFNTAHPGEVQKIDISLNPKAYDISIADYIQSKVVEV